MSHLSKFSAVPLTLSQLAYIQHNCDKAARFINTPRFTVFSGFPRYISHAGKVFFFISTYLQSVFSSVPICCAHMELLCFNQNIAYTITSHRSSCCLRVWHAYPTAENPGNDKIVLSYKLFCSVSVTVLEHRDRVLHPVLLIYHDAKISSHRPRRNLRRPYGIKKKRPCAVNRQYAFYSVVPRRCESTFNGLAFIEVPSISKSCAVLPISLQTVLHSFCFSLAHRSSVTLYYDHLRQHCKELPRGYLCAPSRCMARELCILGAVSQLFSAPSLGDDVR